MFHIYVSQKGGLTMKENYEGIYYISINGIKYTSEQLKLILEGGADDGLQCTLQEKRQGNTSCNPV